MFRVQVVHMIQVLGPGFRFMCSRLSTMWVVMKMFLLASSACVCRYKRIPSLYHATPCMLQYDWLNVLPGHL